MQVSKDGLYLAGTAPGSSPCLSSRAQGTARLRRLDIFETENSGNEKAERKTHALCPSSRTDRPAGPGEKSERFGWTCTYMARFFDRKTSEKLEKLAPASPENLASYSEIFRIFHEFLSPSIATERVFGLRNAPVLHRPILPFIVVSLRLDSAVEDDDCDEGVDLERVFLC